MIVSDLLISWRLVGAMRFGFLAIVATLLLYPAQAARAQAASFAGAQTVVASGFSNIGLVSTDPFGNAYVTDYDLGTITEIYANGAPPQVVARGFSNPVGVSADGGGNLYVGLLNIGTVIKIADNGTQSVLGNVGYPTGTAVDAKGNVFVTNSALIEISPNGQTSKLLSGDYYAVALDAAGNFYMSDYNGTVQFVSADLLTSKTYLSGLGNPEGVAVDGLGNVFVADRYSGVYERSARTGAIQQIGSFGEPAGVAAATGYNAGSRQASFNAVPAMTTTKLVGAVIPNPGSTATLTASVSPQNPGTYAAQPTGTVTFYNGNTPIGTVSVVGGSATLTTTAYAGTQSFTATYNGDTNYTVSPLSNAVPLSFTVVPTISLTTAASYAYGQSFQLSATSNSPGAFAYKSISGPVNV